MSFQLRTSASVSAAAIAVAIFIGSIVGRAQSPPASTGAAPEGDVVVGNGYVLLLIVQDVEKSIGFYGNLLKLTMPPPPAPGPRPYNSNPGFLSMVGISEAATRFATARAFVPGSDMRIELQAYSNIERQPVRARAQDPGGVTVVLLVRDINAAFAPLKQAGVPIVTPGDRPIALGAKGGGHGVVVTDPDGHFVELLQPDPLPATAAPPESNLIGLRVRWTIADTDQTMKVYRDVLHFPVQVGSFGKSALVDLLGLKSAQVRVTNAQIPGTPQAVEFMEVKGVERTPIHPRTQDPGAVRFELNVHDIDATLSGLKAAGATVVTSTLPARKIVTKDPNNVYVQIDAPPLPTP